MLIPIWRLARDITATPRVRSTRYRTKLTAAFYRTDAGTVDFGIPKKHTHLLARAAFSHGCQKCDLFGLL